MFLGSILYSLYNGRLCVQAECCINYEVVAVGSAAFTASLLHCYLDKWTILGRTFVHFASAFIFCRVHAEFYFVA